jgi:hypothetical protein
MVSHTYHAVPLAQIVKEEAAALGRIAAYVRSLAAAVHPAVTETYWHYNGHYGLRR